MNEPEPEREPNLVVDMVNLVASDIDEYEGLDARIKRVMSFREYIHLKERHTTGARAHYRGGPSNQEMQKIVGKVTLLHFDGFTSLVNIKRLELKKKPKNSIQTAKCSIGALQPLIKALHLSSS